MKEIKPLLDKDPIYVWSAEEKFGIDSALYAIFDNLTGYQSFQLLSGLIENNIKENIPHHIFKKIMKYSNQAQNRGEHTAYGEVSSEGLDKYGEEE